jgi:hypothetical protein
VTVDDLFPLPDVLPAKPRPNAYPNLFSRLVANSTVRDEENPRACWEWCGKIRSGSKIAYGHINIWRDGKTVTIKAHRLMLEVALGRPIRSGFEVDHLCHNTLCINPDHLREADFVTNQNNRRGYRAVNTDARSAASP